MLDFGRRLKGWDTGFVDNGLKGDVGFWMLLEILRR
jgi:hypothetical protein